MAHTPSYSANGSSLDKLPLSPQPASSIPPIAGSSSSAPARRASAWDTSTNRDGFLVIMGEPFWRTATGLGEALGRWGRRVAQPPRRAPQVWVAGPAGAYREAFRARRLAFGSGRRRVEGLLRASHALQLAELGFQRGGRVHVAVLDQRPQRGRADLLFGGDGGAATAPR